MNTLATMESELISIAYDAGAKIMEIYASGDFSIQEKQDSAQTSPLTRADTEANTIIETRLKQISRFPVVSEENGERLQADTFWLVDPLDGTKEFIKQNDEFTVNIALIRQGRPVIGVVYAPALDTLYVGNVEQGIARKITQNTEETITAHHSINPPVVVVSKSHRDASTQRMLSMLDDYGELSMGSSLKLCLVAEGAAMLYPRLAPTMLWDTAAAEAVVVAAGGSVTNPDGQPLEYRPENTSINPNFIVRSANCSFKLQATKDRKP